MTTYHRVSSGQMTRAKERGTAMSQPVRQGDVYLVPATIPAKVTPVPLDAGRTILAYGEVTGHAHAIVSNDASLLTTADNARFLRIVGTGATLTHEEHAAVLVAPGEYRVIIGREFTPEMSVRQVVD